jgi:hypothetical protein
MKAIVPSGLKVIDWQKIAFPAKQPAGGRAFG